MQSPQITILGAGLAGLILAASLLEYGYPASGLVLLDAHPPEGGMAPGMLLNPLTGRTLTPKPGYLEAFRFSLQWLHRLEGLTQHTFLLECPLLRPILSPDFARRFARSYEKSRHLSEDVLSIHKLERAALGAAYPLSAPFDECYVIDPVYSVAVPQLIQQLQHRLHQAGVQLSFGQKARRIQPLPSGWRIDTQGGAWDTPRLILANGAGLRHFLPGLPLETLAGSLLVLQANQDLNFAASAAGHIAPLPGRQWICGSTFFPLEQPLSPSADQALLRQQAQRLVPAAADLAVAEHWSGVRAIYTPDREPLVGELPGQPGFFLFSAFAAKGLLWIPFLADSLARHLLEGAPLPARVDARRIGQQALGWD